MDGRDSTSSSRGLKKASAYLGAKAVATASDRGDLVRRAKNTAREADATVVRIAHYVRGLRGRFEHLRTRVEREFPIAPGIVIEAIEALDTSHEELRVADEELRRQNKALAESAHQLEIEKLKYEELFDLAPDGYVVTDCYGVVREANRAAGLMLSISPTFLVGKPLTSFVVRADCRPFLQTLHAARRAHWEGHVELRLRPRLDRAPFLAELTGRAAPANGDTPAFVRWSIRDVSARKRLETSTRDEEIKQSVRARTAELEGTSRSQEKLIEDLLDASRVLAGTAPMIFEAIDLGRLVKATVDAVRSEDARVTVSALHVDLECQVLGDVVRLEQLVRRLILKACPAIEDGDANGAQGQSPDTDCRVNVRVERDGSFALVIVSAAENGRDDDAMSSAAVPDPDLMLPHAIVDLHGGTMRVVRDMEGRWRHFTVRLPMGIVPHKMVEGDGASVDDLAVIDLEGLRTLVVDVDHQGRELILNILRAHGAEVCAASSVADALLLIEDWRPDVLVGDVGLGSDAGFELIRRVRRLGVERGGAVPAVALTGYADLEASRRALLAGYQVHVAKPIDPSLLAHAVANVAGVPITELST